MRRVRETGGGKHDHVIYVQDLFARTRMASSLAMSHEHILQVRQHAEYQRFGLMLTDIARWSLSERGLLAERVAGKSGRLCFGKPGLPTPSISVWPAAGRLSFRQEGLHESRRSARRDRTAGGGCRCARLVRFEELPMDRPRRWHPASWGSSPARVRWGHWAVRPVRWRWGVDGLIGVTRPDSGRHLTSTTS